jgi:hypothetical protein
MGRLVVSARRSTAAGSRTKSARGTDVGVHAELDRACFPDRAYADRRHHFASESARLSSEVVALLAGRVQGVDIRHIDGGIPPPIPGAPAHISDLTPLRLRVGRGDAHVRKLAVGRARRCGSADGDPLRVPATLGALIPARSGTKGRPCASHGRGHRDVLPATTADGGGWLAMAPASCPETEAVEDQPGPGEASVTALMPAADKSSVTASCLADRSFPAGSTPATWRLPPDVHAELDRACFPVRAQADRGHHFASESARLFSELVALLARRVVGVDIRGIEVAQAHISDLTPLRLRLGRGDARVRQLAVGRARRYGVADGDPSRVRAARRKEATDGHNEEAQWEETHSPGQSNSGAALGALIPARSATRGRACASHGRGCRGVLPATTAAARRSCNRPSRNSRYVCRRRALPRYARTAASGSKRSTRLYRRSCSRRKTSQVTTYVASA